jgi:membrane protein required for colicin V production
MNWLDVIILVTLLAGLVGGLATGFIRGLLTLVGLVAAALLAGRLYGALAARLTFLNNEAAASVLGFAIIFLAVMLLTAVVIQVLRSAVQSIMLGWLDRALGGFIGLLLGALPWGLLLTLWAKFFGGGALESSSIASFLVAKFPLALALLPPEFDNVRHFFG